MKIKIILLIIGIIGFFYGVYVMYESSIEVTQDNKNPMKIGDELFASQYPIGIGITLVSFFIGLFSGLSLRKELSNG